MTPFLKQIANHYCKTETSLEGLLFVFAGRRSMVFFKKYLAESVREISAKPVFAPLMLSMDEFLCSFYDGAKADSITALLSLYDCYKARCQEKDLLPDTLDEFVFWGDMLLSDFSDIDKYRVDAKGLLRNVSDYKEIQDDFSDLSETQIEAIRSFLGHFKKEGEYKTRFARLWNMLYDLYCDLEDNLKQKGLACEGTIYRRVCEEFAVQGAEQMLQNAFPGVKKVVFCGLNALNECEKSVLTRLHTLGLAEFCWDWCSDWIKDKANKSSFFMKDNVARYPQAFELEPCKNTPEIEVVSIPSSVGQTKILETIASDNNLELNEKTAIVLPDEALLIPLLDAIPRAAKSVNVTMGYRMGSSSFYSLLQDICSMQMHLRRSADGVWSFYHRQVWSIVGNNIFNALADEKTREIVAAMKKEHRYFVQQTVLCGTPLLDAIFRPVVQQMKTPDETQIASFEEYLCSIADFVGSSIAQNDDLKEQLALEMDFAMEYIKGLNLLSSKKLCVLPQTFARLLDGIMSAKSVPFKGEPLKGLQIMGPLETRALDFDNLFILSCNEAVFPHKSLGASFIPAQLRRGFGLPTYEYQDAVWAYYFYRMIQRPSKVWMLLDSRTEGLKSGEESRYIKQLQYHFGATIKRSVATSNTKAVEEVAEIEKTAEHIQKILSKEFSPTSLQQYLECPVRFYYSFVEELCEEDEVSETMDNAMIGNVYHKVMELIYKPYIGKSVNEAFLDSLLDKNNPTVVNLVRQEVKNQLRTDNIFGRDIVTARIITSYVLETLKRDKEFLKNSGNDSFVIKYLEKNLHMNFQGFKLKGKLDRADSFQMGQIRLVDYKTGKVQKEDVEISDEKAEAIATKIFDPSTPSRPKIALQFFIYDLLLDADEKCGDNMLNCVYSTLEIMKSAPIEFPRNERFVSIMKEKLEELLKEIVNPEVSFNRTPDKKRCNYCDFKSICAR